MKYELGIFDACAKAHGDGIIEDMKKHVKPPRHDMEAHSVVVCVYCDGHLQFAGGNAGHTMKGETVGRATIKREAFSALARLDPKGVAVRSEGGAK